MSTNIQFKPETLAKVKEIIARYPEGKHKSALLPVLHIAQAEFGGWLSEDVMNYVASVINIHAIEVYEVATFYSMYNLKPVGKYHLEVCQTGPCMARGADDTISYLSEKLGIKTGETTPDGMFTLKTVECLGSCGTAPMLQCGERYHENLTPEKIDLMLEKMRAENKLQTYC